MDVHDVLKRVFESSECYVKSFVAVEKIISTSIAAICNRNILKRRIYLIMRGTVLVPLS
jgi:hypothetical protein